MIQTPYLLFLGDAPDWLAAKTAAGIAHWRRALCVGQLSLPGCRADLGLPELSVEAAVEAGAKTLVLGVANRGGKLPSSWLEILHTALDRGLDIANGLHERLSAQPGLADRAARHGRALIDVRHPDRTYPIATGQRRSGRRLLAVGTDCSVGKMFTTLAIEAELRRRGRPADFRATGQTGILIAGDGVPVDAVVADFIAGAIEQLAPAAAADHWDLIEGQGSLFHPSYAGVSLGLLHGAQAEALVLCHEPGRPHLRGLPHYPLPSIEACMAHTLASARLTNPEARFVGLSLNTAAMTPADAAATLDALAHETGLPCIDPVRSGAGPLVDHLLAGVP